MPALFWIPATLVASTAQVARNGLQARLTAAIGTLGATQVRFIFGLPFALIFLFVARIATGEAAPHLTTRALGFVMLGAVSQIGATALMLVAMARRAFGVAYAYIKTEPVLVALFGVLLLGDHLPPLAWTGILVTTGGILLISVDPRQWRLFLGEWRPITTGIVSGALFGLSSVAFRGAITSLETGSALNRALTIMVVGLSIQCLLLGAWLFFFDRRAFTNSLRVWRESVGAGFLGALATAAWFIAFSLTAAANVRTLGVIEMPVAGWFNRHVSGHHLNRREWLGTLIVMGGIVLLMSQVIG